MGTILLFIFLFVILIVMSLLSLLKGVTSAIFAKQSSPFSGYSSDGSYSGNDRRNDSSQITKKVFSESEGEYVKYEEIKE